MSKISVVVPTYLEEGNIRDCLESVRWADEVIVVDAQSQDATQSIAREMGATALEFPREEKNHEKQRWHGIERARHPWILCIDADERVSPPLAEEIRSMLEKGSDVDAYLIPFQNIFFGRLMRHGGLGDTALLRLFRQGKAVYERGGEVHEQLVAKGKTLRLRNPIIHYGTRDLSHYFEKFNLYTSLSAGKLHRQGVRVTWRNALACYVMKPAYYFIKRFFLQKGFLDGPYGLMMAFLSTLTVVVNYLKLSEIQKRQNLE
ncbi:MAG: glycosyltransferase family 2 protein [Thermodesulfobacteriota bacterium]